MSNATAATATLASSNGKATLTLTTGESYTTKDGNRVLATLDRKIGQDGWKREGFRMIEGTMTAELTRTKLLADFVAAR